MKEKKIDKTKPRNWMNGDTFAIKITGINKTYDGKYIILNKANPEKCEEIPNYHYFRVKITKDKIIPALEEINALEYIKTSFNHFEERFWPISGDETYEELLKRKSKVKYYPDEYNYIYIYMIQLAIKRKDNYKDFIYLGNIELNPPFDEHKQLSKKYLAPLVFKDRLLKYVLEAYEDYNLKKSIVYTDIRALKWLEEYRKNEERNEYEDEEVIEESETYVGGGILQSDEKNYEDE